MVHINQFCKSFRSNNRTKFIFALLILISNQAFAQLDSMVFFKHLDGELSEKSQQNGGRYFQSIPINMATGDKVYINSRSNEFLTAIMVRDSAGIAPLYYEKAGKYSNLSSLIAKATYPTKYYYIFTSAELNKTGKFNTDIFYYTKKKDKMSNDAPFKDKLKYIIENGAYNFEFLDKVKKEDKYLDIFKPSIQLLADAESTYTPLNTCYSFRITSTDLNILKKRYTEFEQTVLSIYNDSQQTPITTKDIFGDHEKANFIQGISITLPGQWPHGRNFAPNCKSRITIELDKNDNQTFTLSFNIYG